MGKSSFEHVVLPGGPGGDPTLWRGAPITVVETKKPVEEPVVK